MTKHKVHHTPEYILSGTLASKSSLARVRNFIYTSGTLFTNNL